MKIILSLLTSFAFLFLISCQPEETEAIVKPDTQRGSSAVEEAFPGSVGILEKGTLFGTPIEYAKINGQAVFQGDIILTPEQLAAQPSGERNARTESVGRSNLASRWPNNTVYYTIDRALPVESISRISEAVTHWQNNSAVKFVMRSSETNYVTFRPGDGCSSNVGMIGNQQFIDIGGCSTGSIIHEIGHAVGLWHEQSRADRNNYVNIRWENIKTGEEHNFKTYRENGQDGFDYRSFDFGSIMMYSSYAFSKNSLPTITKKDGSTFSVQRTGLSNGDKSIINLMYFSWTQIPGAAKDISVGADGTAYVISTAPAPGGYQIYKYNGSGWNYIPGGAVRIAVSPQGVPWIVNNAGGIFRLTNGVWQPMPGSAKDIAIGANGTVYIIGTVPVLGSYSIHRWNGSGWSRTTGGGVRIAVGSTGLPAVVNNLGEIYSLNASGTWVRLSGAGVDVAYDAEGTMYVIGTDKDAWGNYGIYRRLGSSWYKLAGAAAQIAAGPKGTPWVLTSDGGIWKGLSLDIYQLYIIPIL